MVQGHRKNSDFGGYLGTWVSGGGVWGSTLPFYLWTGAGARTRNSKHPHSADLKITPPSRPPYSGPLGWHCVPLFLCSPQASSNPPVKARSDGAPISPAIPVTPPSHPAPSVALHGDIPLTNSSSSPDGKAAGQRTSVKETVVVEREVGGGASLAGLESTGAAGSSTRTAFTSSGGVTAVLAGDPRGQMEAVAEQGDDDAFMATGERMEWVERQGNNDGVVDMEVGAGICVAGGWK